MRAWNCKSYRLCLTRAALADSESYPCPCPDFIPDPAAIRWGDVEGSRLLAAAVFRPDAWEIMQELMANEDPRQKGRILRAAWLLLGFRRRDIR